MNSGSPGRACLNTKMPRTKREVPLALSPEKVKELVFWKVDECGVYFDGLRIRGWCHVPKAEITKVEVVFPKLEIVRRLSSFGVPSLDVDRQFGPGAKNVRFEEWVQLPREAIGTPFSIYCWTSDGTCWIGRDCLTNAAWEDQYFQSWETFLESLSMFSTGSVLEVGSRARSALTRRHRIPSRLTYIGLDIMPGPNVDVVGDAHELSRVFPNTRFVAVFSTSVFEHLAMPWKVVLEMNRILVPGGLVFTASHQTWPLHEEPWDFWRFSPHAWNTLFNSATGFEVIAAVVGEPARIHPCRAELVTRDVPSSPAYLGSAALVRKTGETSLSWPVPLSSVTNSMYPEGELPVAPTKNRT